MGDLYKRCIFVKYFHMDSGGQPLSSTRMEIGLSSCSPMNAFNAERPNHARISPPLTLIPYLEPSPTSLANQAQNALFPAFRTQLTLSSKVVMYTPHEPPPFSSSLRLPIALSCSNLFSLRNSLLCLNL